jgi:hypothetical protein
MLAIGAYRALTPLPTEGALEQRRHIGLEFLGVSRSPGRDVMEDGATAAQKQARRAPQLEPRQAEACGNQALAADCHRCDP